MAEQVKVLEYFNTVVSPQEFARIMRRYNQEVVRMHMALQKRPDEYTSPEVIADSMFFLNELLETIDPYLTKK